MAYTTINKSTDYFNTKLYTGNGGTQAVTGVGFQPDWCWIKNRGAAESHVLFDAVRGVQKSINSNTTSAEATSSNYLTVFGTDGFTVGASGLVNDNSNTYASWNWKANGQGSANTDGSINTTYTSVNTTAGFSISSFTGTGANATVGHGLGVAPKVIITKSLANSENWGFYHESLGNTKQLVLNTNGAVTGASSAYYNNTSPTSTVFSVGTADSTNDAANMIAYCFAEKAGYSKFGSYTGNGNANGTFIYTGFKPAMIITKRTDASDHWTLWDNKRETTMNPNDNVLYPSTSGAESTSDTSYACDFLSNGVKWRGTSTGMNASGGSYIYMAFGQSIVGSNNVPATAR